MTLVRLDVYKGRDRKGDETESHDQPEEFLIAYVLGDEARHHAGQHHATQILTCRADGKDGSRALATGEGDKIERVGGETKTIAYLLDADTGADEPEIVGREIAEIDVDDVWQSDAKHQRPETLLQAPFRDSPTTDNATQQEASHTQRAVDETEVHVAHGKTALGCATQEEQRNDLGEQTFGQTEQEDETECRAVVPGSQTDRVPPSRRQEGRTHGKWPRGS